MSVQSTRHIVINCTYFQATTPSCRWLSWSRAYHQIMKMIMMTIAFKFTKKLQPAYDVGTQSSSFLSSSQLSRSGWRFCRKRSSNLLGGPLYLATIQTSQPTF